MDKKIFLMLIIMLVLGAFVLEHAVSQTDAASKLDVSSSAFKQGERIPIKYTCDSQDVSPPIAWSKGPAPTASYALVMDDPDAPSGTFTHWVIFNIPATVTSLDENVPALDRLPDGSVQGKNDFGRIGYGGPCPPGGLHHYRFHVYALDIMPGLSPRVSNADLQRALKGHILADGELTGTFRR